jgi:hypothetical protein
MLDENVTADRQNLVLVEFRREIHSFDKLLNSKIIHEVLLLFHVAIQSEDNSAPKYYPCLFG